MNKNPMEQILVAGANGTTGKKIIQLLQESQYFEPIAMVRTEEQLKHFESQNVKAVLGDLENDISHTVLNIDKVIFAAGSGGKNLKAIDQEGAKKLIKASKNANVKKFVMLSSMGADRPESNSELKEYLKAKHNADEFLKASGLNFTIVRPGSLNNNKGNGKIELAKSISKPGEITRDDVAQTLVWSLYDDTAQHTTFEIVQGETLIGEALNNFL